MVVISIVPVASSGGGYIISLIYFFPVKQRPDVSGKLGTVLVCHSTLARLQLKVLHVLKYIWGEKESA